MPANIPNLLTKHQFKPKHHITDSLAPYFPPTFAQTHRANSKPKTQLPPNHKTCIHKVNGYLVCFTNSLDNMLLLVLKKH